MFNKKSPRYHTCSSPHTGN